MRGLKNCSVRTTNLYSVLTSTGLCCGGRRFRKEHIRRPEDPRAGYYGAGHRWLVQEGGEDAQGEPLNQLISQANEYYPHAVEGKQSDMPLTFENGSVIIFAGLDDVEKLKSITESRGSGSRRPADH